jgi:Zn-finger nucleic acid-binding protein
MPNCPNCRQPLTRVQTGSGITYDCPGCGGRLIGLGVLRHLDISQNLLTEIWQRVVKLPGVGNRACPHCGQTMTQIGKSFNGGMLTLDICGHCQCIWFDTKELESLPRREPESPKLKDQELSPKAREALAMFMTAERQRQENIFDKDTDTVIGVTDLLRALIGFLSV